MVLGVFPGNQPPPPQFVDWAIHHLGRKFLYCWANSGHLLIIAGRFLPRRKHYLFVFVVARCECLFMPFGTILGVFTIILLSRESMKSTFE